ncbi:hypothetical protein [Neobacillus sp. SAB-20_R2A]|uniref:hypothetical protein n=1 Tax=Neobacillus sp. SAB-20_R2A TaxID=3120519 RepID=UPI003C6DFF11
MKRKLFRTFIVLILLVLIYDVNFRTKTVTYLGEDANWSIKINSKLVGLNGSYRIEVQYKGSKSIEYIDFNIHPPHYEAGIPSLDEKGFYQWECKDDCGFYDKDEKLLFFIVWKEGHHSEEKMRFIDLKKIPTNWWK